MNNEEDIWNLVELKKNDYIKCVVFQIVDFQPIEISETLSRH